MEVGPVGIDVDGSGSGLCVAAVSLSIGDITVTLPAATQPPTVFIFISAKYFYPR